METDEEIKALLMDAAKTGREWIEPRKELHKETIPPREIWEALGKAGLLGICIRKQFGGRGLSIAALGRAMEELVLAGGNLGIALAVLMHNLVTAHYIQTFGDAGQCRSLLPDLASGKITPGVGVSEKNAGAHPKHLKTTATSVDSGYKIQGAKSFVTGGPVADLFVVIAKTEKKIEKNKCKNFFSAFLVIKGAAGCLASPPFDLGMLCPSCHGGLSLEQVQVDKGALLGRKDHAYPDMVIPFYKLEQALIRSLFAAGLLRRARDLTRTLMENSMITHKTRELLGRLKAGAGASMILSRQMVKWAGDSITNPLAPMAGVHLAGITKENAGITGEILKTSNITLPEHLDTLGRDLAGLAAMDTTSRPADLIQEENRA